MVGENNSIPLNPSLYGNPSYGKTLKTIGENNPVQATGYVANALPNADLRVPIEDFNKATEFFVTKINRIRTTLATLSRESTVFAPLAKLIQPLTELLAQTEKDQQSYAATAFKLNNGIRDIEVASVKNFGANFS